MPSLQTCETLTTVGNCLQGNQMNYTPPHPDAKLSRRDTSAAFKAAGYRVSESTLARLASRGGGPPFHKFGKYPLYRWGDSLAWAEGKLRSPVRSTSELPPTAKVR
jgi:hypothetical protein